MKKAEKKTNEAQLLDLLKRVLPKATPDAKLAGKIYLAVEKELMAKNRAVSFEKFCERSVSFWVAPVRASEAAPERAPPGLVVIPENIAS